MKKLSLKTLKKTRDNDLLTVFPKHIYGYKRSELRAMRDGNKLPSPKDKLKRDRIEFLVKSEETSLRNDYKESLRMIEKLERKIQTISAFKNTVDTYSIKPKKRSLGSEATAVWVASDWHTDEYVDEKSVNGLNQFNFDIAKQRVENFFKSGLRLTDILAQDVQIDTIVLALLGDFYTGHIHEDFMEITDTQPIHAVIRVQNMIASGIEFILKNSDYKLVIPCHSGNHARTTDNTRFATESGHSLEFYMYHFLSDYFKNEPRVKFIIPAGYHSYFDIYGLKIRFHHGHALRYGGGIGGIYIPVNKAIAQWNKAFKADLDVFGHFHQMRDGGNFICNGSLIGYSAFALSIKADYEKPKQTLFLIDKERGKTAVWPILV